MEVGKLGLKTFSLHKGYAAQSRTLGHFASPADVEKAALDNPDLTFIIYHSALKHDPSEPEFKKPGYFDPSTGDFAWHDVLMKIKERNPKMTNVYPEIGSAFGNLAIQHPIMCQHLMGKNIKNYGVDHVIWGTDCLWWGSPQWVIDAFADSRSPTNCATSSYKKLPRTTRPRSSVSMPPRSTRWMSMHAQALPADACRSSSRRTSIRGQRENAAYGCAS